ncbi:hypothetical protein [Hymenobacter sp. BT190]|uniref:hypothetical protein n=1 Tax=Hymenobacter sp. BT190 TaxID=2763505 RepID=UPI001651484B|nr:hypothetical protein [Hymenobacter sp. BT190]
MQRSGEDALVPGLMRHTLSMTFQRNGQGHTKLRQLTTARNDKMCTRFFALPYSLSSVTYAAYRSRRCPPTPSFRP